jgi:hypothetical protein
MAKKAKKEPKTSSKKANASVDVLNQRLKELEAENAKLKEVNASKSKIKNRHFWRTFGVTFFVTLSIVAFMLFNIASWAKNTILNTESFVATMQPVLAEPAVQEVITNELSTQIFSNIDIQSELEKALPEDIQFIAGPLAGGVESFVNDQIANLLASPKVYEVWGQVLTTVHGTLVAYIQDPTKDGVISINDLYVFIGEQVSSDNQLSFLFNKQLPANIGSITLAEIEWLPQARTYVDTLSALPYILIGTSIVSFIIALALAKRKRATVLTAAILSFILMICTIVALEVGQMAISNQVQPQYADASEAVYSTITQPLADRTMGYATLFGFVVLLFIITAPLTNLIKVRQFTDGHISSLANRYIPKKELPDWLYWLPENRSAVLWTTFAILFIGIGVRIPPLSEQIINGFIWATIIVFVLYIVSSCISATRKSSKK